MELTAVHVYFAEKDTLLEVFDAWPDKMGAIILLEEEGDGHNISLFHSEETERVLGRLGARLGLSRDDLILVSPDGVGPAAEGHPRVRIKYSDDREILDLISHHPDLPERARDYKINFEYVRDQGLGTGLDNDLNPITPDGEAPLIFTPIPKEPKRPLQDEIVWGEIQDDPEPNPGSGPDPTEDLYCLDVPAAPDLVAEYRILDGSVRIRGDRVILRPRGHDPDPEEVREVAVIGFRDDLSDLLLPPESVEETRNGRLPVLTLPLQALPDGFFGPTPIPRRVRISVTPWGVRVRPVSGLPGLIGAWPARPIGLSLMLFMGIGLLVRLGTDLLSSAPGP